MPSAKKPVETKTATEVVKEPEVVAEVKKPVSKPSDQKKSDPNSGKKLVKMN